MTGFTLSEQAHIVPLIYPKNISGGVTAIGAFSMAKYRHATIIIIFGAQAAANTKILLNECTSTGGASATNRPFSMYLSETSDTDVLSTPRTAVTSAGFTPSANADIYYVIEYDAAEGDDGFPYIQLQITNGANANFATAVAILSGSRNAYAGSPSVMV